MKWYILLHSSWLYSQILQNFIPVYKSLGIYLLRLIWAKSVEPIFQNLQMLITEHKINYMRRNGKMTYRIFKLRVWERELKKLVQSTSCFSKVWECCITTKKKKETLPKKFLRMHSWKISCHNLIIGLAKQSFNQREITPKKTHRFSSCFIFEIENGISPLS